MSEEWIYKYPDHETSGDPTRKLYDLASKHLILTMKPLPAIFTEPQHVSIARDQDRTSLPPNTQSWLPCFRGCKTEAKRNKAPLLPKENKKQFNHFSLSYHIIILFLKTCF
jgi:hypothetical protein